MTEIFPILNSHAVSAKAVNLLGEESYCVSWFVSNSNFYADPTKISQEIIDVITSAAGY